LKTRTLKRPRNASRIPTLPRHKILHPITIPPRTILPAAPTTALARILAAAETVTEVETVAVIAAVVAVGVAGADVIAADARKLVRADAICLHLNMLPRKAASPADMTIVVDNRAVTTIGVRKLRAPRRLPRQASPRKKSFFRVNRWQNIAASLPLRPRLFPSLNMKHARSRTPSKKLRRA
jgi:hypothetical protein